MPSASAIVFVLALLGALSSCKMTQGAARDQGAELVSVADRAQLFECRAIGTSREGWYRDDRLVVLAQCGMQRVECRRTAMGEEEKEGWYAFERQNDVLVRYADCARVKARPKCVGEGTQEEHWELDGGVIASGPCLGKALVCLGAGTRAEGWYASDKKNATLIQPEHCAI